MNVPNTLTSYYFKVIAASPFASNYNITGVSNHKKKFETYLKAAYFYTSLLSTIFAESSNW